MKVKIKIRTPEGQAEGTYQKIGWFFGALNRAKINAWVNKKNDTMFLEIEGTPKQVLSVTKNVNYFNALPSVVLENRILKLASNKLGTSPQQFEELKKMFTEGTKITVIKKAQADEIQEDNKTYWEKIKEKFRSFKPNK